MTWCGKTPSAVCRATVIEKQKEQIYSAATHNAKERVKVQFLLQKIAEKEDIKVSQEEIATRVHYLAGLYQIAPDKFLKDLQKRNGLIEVYDQIMNEKVIDFLEQNAKYRGRAAGGLGGESELKRWDELQELHQLHELHEGRRGRLM